MENNFTVECNACGQHLENWVGSTPCCGSIAFLVKDGEKTTDAMLYASIGSEDIKPTKISFEKK